MRGLVASFVLINSCYCLLWKKGIVHYSINKLDYDFHSQEVITTTLAKLQNEICIKFFITNGLDATSNDTQLLYISNPDKIKSCQPYTYNFDGSVVLMPIGYRCINEKAIARAVAEMLKASIERIVINVNSYDLVKKFQDKDSDPTRLTLLPAAERNYINAHSQRECGSLSQRAPRRRSDGGNVRLSLSTDNVRYYDNKLWPLGIVMFGVEEKLRNTNAYAVLKHAMTSIELSTCIVFEEYNDDQVLSPKNLLWFASDGEDTPAYGFRQGNQTIKLESMAYGAPGHTAHALNNLMRSLGVPMMSNRHDRDNYITINWKTVQRGKEQLLEKMPPEAWLEHMVYDFDSATHAPANFACQGCELGGATVQPLQDHLWQKTLTMGHRTGLSVTDVEFLTILYGKQCRSRFVPKKIK